jgi:hypothetical protein
LVIAAFFFLFTKKLLQNCLAQNLAENFMELPVFGAQIRNHNLLDVISTPDISIEKFHNTDPEGV